MTESDSPRCGWPLPPRPGIAVVGASGLVGTALMEVLQRRGFPHRFLEPVGIRDFELPALADADLIFLAAPPELALAAAPELRRPGRILVDLSDAWRLDPDVPLVIAGVNDETLEAHRGLVACPNCTNVGLVVVLHALATVLNVSRATVTSMQAASGGGRSMLEGLQEGRAEGADCLAGNLLPLCDVLLDDGRSAEERRLQVESTRLLGAAMPPLDATCVRVPVEVGHALSLTLHCEEDVSLAAVREGLSLHPDIHVAAEASIQTPKRVRGKEGVFVGRVRVGGNARTVQMWIVIDNLLTGAASNAVRIAEKLLP